MENGAIAMEDSVVIPQKIENRITVCSSNSILGVYIQKNWKQGAEKIFVHLHP